MFMPIFIAALIGVLFLVAWHYTPKRTLTAIMGGITSFITWLYTATQDMGHLLREAVPEDYAPFFLIGLVGLTVWARYRESQ